MEKTLTQDQPENNNVYEIMLEIGRKRGCLLNQKYKYIGITHSLLDNTFVAIFSFAS